MREEGATMENGEEADWPGKDRNGTSCNITHQPQL